jgi:hypothetical protein
VAEQPVINLDDTFENRNWLRIVGQMRQGKTREEALAAIKAGEAPNHTPTSIFLHDTVKEEAEDRAGSLDE